MLKKIKYLLCLVAKKVREKKLQIEFFFQKKKKN